MRRALLAVAVALAGAAASCVHWLHPAESHAGEVHYVTTDDGWQLALHHFPPAAGAPARRHPVVICHGVMSNRYNWELHDDGFPIRAARAGFDTWLVELRASGASARPGWFDDLEWDYGFDAYVLHDVPALIDYVRAKTGSAQVHWVGHSMGTMVLYGYLQRVGQEAVRSAVLVAPPLYVFDHNERLELWLGLLPVASFLFDRFPSGKATALFSPWAFPAVVAEEHLIWNYDNIGPKTARTAAAHAVDDISVGVVEQFAASFGRDSFRSADGSHDYTRGLAGVEVPLFFVAGSLDQLAPPAQALEAYARVGSKDKRVEVFSRANGYAHDYGHVDLVLGRTAAQEVFPELLGWLTGHD